MSINLEKIIDTGLDIVSFFSFPVFIAKVASDIIAPLPARSQSHLSENIIMSVAKPVLGVVGINIDKTDYSIYQYVGPWVDYLIKTWGLENAFSEKAAELIVRMSAAGLNPQITSGYRSTATQQDLYTRWQRGDPNIYTPAIPGTSPHERTNWLGQPSAKCFDCTTNYPFQAAKIAAEMGIEYGYPADPVHFGDLKLT
jgi:hypothetical protein